jgi:hypothetical protein
MKKQYTNYAMLLVVGSLSLLQACQKDDQFRSDRIEFPNSKHGERHELENKFYSSTLPIGDGVVRAWVTQNKDGEPVAVGVNSSN